VYETAELSEAEGLKLELERGWPIFSTADAKEGSKAFAERRPAVFRRE
jgi:enoyl-CoA hydratase